MAAAEGGGRKAADVDPTPEFRIPLQSAPTSKIPAPLLVGGAPKKDPKSKSGGARKKASYATEFGEKKRKVRKVLRPKAASGTTRTPSKRQVGGGSFSNLLEKEDEEGESGGGGEDFGPAEDFSRNFGPTHKGDKNKKRPKRKRDPFDNPDTLFAGQPGAPESQSYFELMGDFFEKPDINVFDEVNAATKGPVFPNFPAQDIDRSTRRTPIFVDESEPIFREEMEGKVRRLHRPTRGPTFGPVARFETGPTRGPTFGPVARFEVGPTRGPAFGPASRFEAGPEFEALKENLANIGNDEPFGHTTPLYHPYAKPLSHHNPLDETHEEGDVEVFRDSVKARKPTAPPLPEPLPLEQEQPGPFSPPQEPPRLKAPRRLKLPQMNVGQILDDHREPSHPVYSRPLGPLSSVPTPPISKPPKIFDFDPPIDFPEPEPFGPSEPFTERPTPFFRQPHLAPSTRREPPRFSSIPKFDRLVATLS